MSYANVMATVAVFLALGGGAYAALGKNSVGSKQVKRNSLKAKDLGASSVTASEAAANAIGQSEIANDAIGTSEIANSVPAVGVNSGANSVLLIATAQNVAFVNEDYDTASMHDGSPSTDLVAPADGAYLVTGVTQWNSGASTGFHTMQLFVNTVIDPRFSVSVPYDEEFQVFSTVLVLDAGDAVRANVSNDTDDDVGTNTKLNMVWIAPGPA